MTRVQITTPEGVASTLHRPKPVHTATVFFPKDTVVIRLFFQADPFDAAQHHLTAKPLQKGLQLQARTGEQTLYVFFYEEYVSRAVAAAGGAAHASEAQSLAVKRRL
jgi:hypothetical protein